MDLEEDERLLQAFQAIKHVNSDEWKHSYEHEKAQRVKLQVELKQQFQIISKQAEVIRRYRTLLKHSMKKENTENLSETRIKKRSQEPSVEEEETAEEEKVASPPSKKTKTNLKALKTAMSTAKSNRLQELVQQNCVRYPTAHDDYREIHIGQAIWRAIIRAFKSHHGSMVTTNMIIAEGGSNVMSLPGQKPRPFLTVKMIDRYFSYPFSVVENDPTFTVRPLATEKGREWVVLMPEWVQKKIEDESWDK